MIAPSPLDDNNMRLALLRKDTATGAELSELCSAPRRDCDVPNSSTDAPTQRTTIHERMDTTEIARGDGKILRFAIKRSNGTRERTGPMDAPIKRGFVATKRKAIQWMSAEILRLQCEADSKQMGQ